MNWNEINIDEMGMYELLEALGYVTEDVPRVFLHDNRSDDIYTVGDVNDDEFYVSQWVVEARISQIETRLRYLLSL